MIKPDYYGGSIVNFICSIKSALGSEDRIYRPLLALEPDTIARANNVVLLILDGLGYEYLSSQGAGSELHRHLKGKMTSVFPSTTATAITTYLTGTAPQQHGITGWFTYFKELGLIASILPFRPRFSPISLAAQGLDAAELIGTPGVFDSIHRQCYFVIHQRLVESPYSTYLAGNAQRRSYEDLASYFSAIESCIKEDSQQKFVYAYWPDFDGLAHRHGVNSVEVQQHFQQIDQGFKGLLDALQGTDTQILCTADHGFIDIKQEWMISMENHPRLQECLILPLTGEPRAAYCYVRPHKVAQFENYVRHELSAYCQLYRSEDLLKDGWFGLGEMHPRLVERIGDYVLMMKDNYILVDALQGEEHAHFVGVHGGTSSAEMYVPLIMAYS